MSSWLADFLVFVIWKTAVRRGLYGPDRDLMRPHPNGHFDEQRSLLHATESRAGAAAYDIDFFYGLLITKTHGQAQPARSGPDQDGTGYAALTR
ncbi:hypothetical protein ACI2KG_24845 [Pseudomonas sp. NPDC089407]|uniref:hypothetical protein n=1 Tax=Pseudomonas sp. NPDC089407 TaxID=3364464 RepID=UPI00384F0906